MMQTLRFVNELSKEAGIVSSHVLVTVQLHWRTETGRELTSYRRARICSITLSLMAKRSLPSGTSPSLTSPFPSSFNPHPGRFPTHLPSIPTSPSPRG